ncbi:hypothetical protein [Anaeromusa acidaminophila]|uniref:hypothetical protein n=1 Tax=Anaeromusa acidaminophila TaxID=81464 RepID=UPI0003634AE7|nr:hypothetical protein [Anaeromusa acidaminophila]
MKITESTVKLSSQHTAVSKTQEQETLEAWVDGKQGNKAGMDAVKVDVSALAKELQQKATGTEAAKEVSDPFELSDENKRKLEMLQRFMEALTGKKFKFVIPQFDKETRQAMTTQLSLQLPAAGSGGGGGSQAGGPQRVGWGVRYDYSREHYEAEQVSFQAQGLVKTGDGREIRFDMQMNMSRELYQSEHVSLKAGDAAIDPLVIEFGQPFAKFSGQKVNFDLDSDGSMEEIPFLASGSGFLMLDKNNDGKATDGSELFGPSTGQGFSELAAYDADGNQWIDENDPIYNKLRIWTKDANGQDQLLALGQAGVGAIYLGNVATEFSMKDAAGNAQGQMRTSSVFLKENGQVGMVKQIDLIV